MKKGFSYKLAVAIFVIPSLLLFTVVVCYPIIQTIYRSFYDWDGIGIAKFIGLDNYADLFTDSNFKTSAKNGFIFAGLLVVYQIGLGTVFALLLSNKRLFLRKFYKTTYFIPVVLSTTVACMLWSTVYNVDNGILNKLFELVGIPYRQSWLSDLNLSIYAVAFVNAWQNMGVHMILIFAGIQSIPEHYYEAAMIDGATSAQAHRHVTLPLLAETYRFCLIIAITGGLKAFDTMYIMTSGGPGTATYTLTYMMYSSAFRSNAYGYACAAATMLVLLCLFFTIVINRFVAHERISY